MKTKGIPPIKRVMTPFPHTIEADEPLARARSMMEEHGVRHLPVTEGGRLAGILSDRDLRKGSAEGGDTTRSVRDVCVFHAYLVELNEPLDNVVLHMAEAHIGSALVVKDGKLAGIFTAVDACRYLAELLRSIHPRGGDDLVA